MSIVISNSRAEDIAQNLGITLVVKRFETRFYEENFQRFNSYLLVYRGMLSLTIRVLFQFVSSQFLGHLTLSIIEFENAFPSSSSTRYDWYDLKVGNATRKFSN